MSGKKRRDITLGEMQDECRRRNAFCGDMGACPYRDFCRETVGDKCGWGDKGPRDWNLTDPPRFNDAQMALLKGFYEIGIRAIERIGYAMWSTQGVNGSYVSIVKELGLKENETLDLAELLGKESNEK